MRTRIVIGVLMASILALPVAAQVENDDMYFKAKDREKLRAEQASSSITANDKIDNDYKAFKKKHFEESEEVAENVNPTDSYSARTVNPEYISRSNSEQASEDEQNYYVEGYTPPNTYDSYSGGNYNSNFSNNWANNNWNYRNSWYGNSFYDPFYSPYYGFRDPWMNPYYSGGSGWTMSLGYTWGTSWGPGWNYGMGYGWGGNYNPYGYYSPYSNWGYSNWGYPTYYNNGGYYENNSGVTYGKRPSRHSAVVTPTQRSNQRVTNNGNTNGRVRQTSDEYYVKPMRRTSTFENSYSRPTSSSPGTRTRESYNSNSRESSRPSYSTPSRSSSYSTPSRSSSGGSTPSRSSGGSSGSRPRGGN